MTRHATLAVGLAAAVIAALLVVVPRGATVARGELSFRAFLPLTWRDVARDALPAPEPILATATSAPTTASATPSDTPTREASAMPSPTATEPVPTPTTPAGGSITGRLLVGGDPAVVGLGVMAGPALYLRRCSSGGADCTNLERGGVYDAEGHYKFESPASLAADEFYQVLWVNEDNPPETLGDRQYLGTWYGRRITSYEAGDEVSGGDFELADIALVAPSNGTSFGFAGAPNLTFAWEKRSKEIGGYTYQWGICSADSGCCQSVHGRPSAWLTGPLGQAEKWTMTAYPPNVQIGTAAHPFTYPYCWFLRIQSMEAYTYGESYFIRKIWFYSALQGLARLGLVHAEDWGGPSAVTLGETANHARQEGARTFDGGGILAPIPSVPHTSP